MEIRFCYRIAAAAELAYDLETGEPADAFMQVKLEVKNYDETHVKIGLDIAKQHDLNPDWIIPISTEEYDREHSEESEQGC